MPEIELSEFGLAMQGMTEMRERAANTPAAPRPVPAARTTPPPDGLPAELGDAITEADTAWEEYCEFEAEHHEILDPSWLRTAEDRDRDAARRAPAGTDVLTLPSTVQEWTVQRPRLLGRLDALHDRVTATQGALRTALHTHASDMLNPTGRTLQEAAERFIATQQALNAARAEFGRALSTRVYWQHLANGTDPGNYRPAESIPPRFSEGGLFSPAVAIRDHDGPAARAVAGVEHAFREWFGADLYTAEPDQHEDQTEEHGPATAGSHVPHAGIIERTR